LSNIKNLGHNEDVNCQISVPEVTKRMLIAKYQELRSQRGCSVPRCQVSCYSVLKCAKTGTVGAITFVLPIVTLLLTQV